MLSVFSCSPAHCYANYAISWCSRVADIKQTDSTRHWGREPQAVVSLRHVAGIMCAGSLQPIRGEGGSQLTNERPASRRVTRA